MLMEVCRKFSRQSTYPLGWTCLKATLHPRVIRTGFRVSDHKYFCWIQWKMEPSKLSKSNREEFCFSEITPRSQLKDNRPFGETGCFHHRGRRISQARNQSEARNKLRSWRCRRHVPSKRGLILNGLHGVVSEKRTHEHRCEHLKS
jgi:hypothetical protein